MSSQVSAQIALDLSKFERIEKELDKMVREFRKKAQKMRWGSRKVVYMVISDMCKRASLCLVCAYLQIKNNIKYETVSSELFHSIMYLDYAASWLDNIGIRKKERDFQFHILDSV